MGVRRICVNRTRTKMTQKMIEKKPKRKIEKPNWKDECMADEKKSFSIFKRFNFLFFFSFSEMNGINVSINYMGNGCVCLSSFQKVFKQKKKKNKSNYNIYILHIHTQKHSSIMNERDENKTQCVWITIGQGLIYKHLFNAAHQIRFYGI